jgi:hypothetical protein
MLSMRAVDSMTYLLFTPGGFPLLTDVHPFGVQATPLCVKFQKTP